MPQMAPLSWLSLMLLFIIVMMMFNIMNFFSLKYNIKKSQKQIKTTKKNWKW